MSASRLPLPSSRAGRVRLSGLPGPRRRSHPRGWLGSLPAGRSRRVPASRGPMPPYVPGSRTGSRPWVRRRLHGLLAALDPAAASTILPTNGRRVVRALEVIDFTGRPFRHRCLEPSYAFDRVVQLGIDVPRDILDRGSSSGYADVGGGIRGGGRAASNEPGCGRGGRRVGRSATGRYWPSRRGHRRGARPSRQTVLAGRKRFARRQDSVVPRDPRIRLAPFGAPDLWPARWSRTIR